MRSTPIRQATVNEGSATRLADADGGRRSVAPFRLRRYTAAASAAALGSAANAAIVTGGTVSSGEFATPLNGSTTPLDKSDFGNALNVKFSVSRIVEERRLKVAQDGNTAGSFQFLRTSAQNNATFNNKLILRRDAVGMGYGDVIDANAANTASYREWANSALLAWSSRSGVDWIGNSGEWRLDGYTPNSVRHYLAFRFTDDGGSTYQYGWMDVEWWGQQTNDNVELTVHGWAYNNTGGSITAGFSGTAVPSGGGVLALAAGAAGLRGRRRGRA